MSRLSIIFSSPKRTLAALATVLVAVGVTAASGADFNATSANSDEHLLDRHAVDLQLQGEAAGLVLYRLWPAPRRHSPAHRLRSTSGNNGSLSGTFSLTRGIARATATAGATRCRASSTSRSSGTAACSPQAPHPRGAATPATPKSSTTSTRPGMSSGRRGSAPSRAATSTATSSPSPWTPRPGTLPGPVLRLRPCSPGPRPSPRKEHRGMARHAGRVVTTLLVAAGLSFGALLVLPAVLGRQRYVITGGSMNGTYTASLLSSTRSSRSPTSRSATSSRTPRRPTPGSTTWSPTGSSRSDGKAATFRTKGDAPAAGPLEVPAHASPSRRA